MGPRSLTNYIQSPGAPSAHIIPLLLVSLQDPQFLNLTTRCVPVTEFWSMGCKQKRLAELGHALFLPSSPFLLAGIQM